MFKGYKKPIGGLRQLTVRLLGRKRKGNIIDWLGSVIVILAIVLLILSYLNFTRVFDIKEDVKQVSREYMLKMETVGYLTPEDSVSLTNRLNALGVKNIDLTGSTVGEPAGYGNSIVLSIKCTIPGETLDLNSGILNSVFRDTPFPMTVIRESTAKY